ncbi:MAG TPA: energy-coupling factor transporter transmembrane component T [Candidatus Limnocylindria bacterium]|nr:energy-coupling factor transporter transmembrane component T [Candidatus Limnocylindria bacterium]
MSALDPRAQLALFAAILLGVLFGGMTGLVAGGAIAIIWTARSGASRARAPLAAVLPLALFVALLDAFAGRTSEGIAAGLRLVETTALALAFARSVDARAMTDALRALRLPHSFVFVLLAGARFVPVTGADLGELVTAARLRGIGVDAGPWRRLAAWRALLVPLLVITVRRGLQLGEAMEARGFSTASRRTVRTELRWRVRDSVAGLAALLYLALIALIGSRLP